MTPGCDFRRDDRLGGFDEILAGAPDHAETLRALLSLVARACPGAVEAASRKQANVWWGIGPAKMSDGFAYAAPHAAHVKLGFFGGVSLPDPEGRLTGTGKSLRQVKLDRPDDVTDPSVVALLEAAVDERRAAWGG